MNPPGALRLVHDAMACIFGIRFADTEEAYACRAAQAAFDEIDRVEQLFSRFVAHSEIAQLNRTLPGEPVPLSPDTVACLEIAAAAFSLTGRAFDVAYRSRPRAPQRADGAPAAPLIYDPARRVAGATYANIDLDLGAIGKGFAVDRAVAVLREWRISAALVDAGQSTVFALGAPHGAAGWRVQLRGLDAAPETAAMDKITLRDQALSGSGQVLHGPHIVDPRRNAAVPASRATWAIAASAAWSDALSTAFMSMTEEEIAAVCAARGDIRAIVRDVSGASEIVRHYPPR